jgi:hypothetical protein
MQILAKYEECYYLTKMRCYSSLLQTALQSAFPTDSLNHHKRSNQICSGLESTGGRGSRESTRELQNYRGVRAESDDGLIPEKASSKQTQNTLWWCWAIAIAHLRSEALRAPKGSNLKRFKWIRRSTWIWEGTLKTSSNADWQLRWYEQASRYSPWSLQVLKTWARSNTHG